MYLLFNHFGNVLPLSHCTLAFQTVPICEVEAYNRMDGFGIFVTIRAVGRARIVEVIQVSLSVQFVC